MDRVEAAGCPALVLHRIPSCRPEAAPGWLDGSGDVQPDIAQVYHADRSRNRCARDAWRGRIALSNRPMSFISSVNPRRSPGLARAGRRGVEPSPAAGRLAGDLLIQALLHESAERSQSSEER